MKLGNFGIEIPATSVAEKGAERVIEIARTSVETVAGLSGYTLRHDLEVVEHLDDGSIRYWIKGERNNAENDDEMEMNCE